MSVLIAYKKDDTIYMGTDTRLVRDDNKTSGLCESDYKIQKTDDGMLVGITSDDKIKQHIFAHLDVFSLDKNSSLTRKHIVNVIIPDLKEVLKKENLLIEKDDKLPKMDTVIILAYKEKAFLICNDFMINSFECFQADGDASVFGKHTLLKAYNENDKTLDVNNLLVKSLDIIAKHNCMVGRPFLLIDTKKQSYSLTEE